jgi:hypothetical protein
MAVSALERVTDRYVGDLLHHGTMCTADTKVKQARHATCRLDMTGDNRALSTRLYCGFSCSLARDMSAAVRRRERQLR